MAPVDIRIMIAKIISHGITVLGTKSNINSDCEMK